MIRVESRERKPHLRLSHSLELTHCLILSDVTPVLRGAMYLNQGMCMTWAPSVVFTILRNKELSGSFPDAGESCSIVWMQIAPKERESVWFACYRFPPRRLGITHMGVRNDRGGSVESIHTLLLMDLASTFDHRLVFAWVPTQDGFIIFTKYFYRLSPLNNGFPFRKPFFMFISSYVCRLIYLFTSLSPYSFMDPSLHIPIQLFISEFFASILLWFIY